MKFTKQAIALAILSASSFAASAATVDVYGKAILTVQNSDEGEGSFTEVKSHNSRIGLKGSHELRHGLEVVYKAEFKVDMDGDSDDNISSRNQYVGLKGGFGEVLLGKNDTALKKAQGKVDLFSDLDGDIKQIWKGENRLADTITYKSPKFANFKLALTYIAEDSLDAEDGISASLAYGDAGLKKSKFYAAVAVDSEVNGYDVARIVASTKVAGVTLGAIAQTQEKVDSDFETDGFMVSAKYSVMKNLDLKAQVQTADTDGGDDKSGFTVGADYKLAKSTKVFGYFTSFDMDSQADEDYLAVGVEYKF
ncbi:porin [Thalassotalea euphylliae]|uniref:Porin n=1 Tax=Thalassotalea euphylliae TaxID=1655234 RepID=A0A3E0UKZ9_9GAMM|nr:porin [Thalassotalea euphylliae]REL36412.1 porin [Thalassotalea euphylliae]